MRILFLLAIVALAYTADPSVPIFPPQYTLAFNESAKIVTTGTTTGIIYFDEPANREVIERANGAHDRYCGTVFKTANTPCNHIVLDGTSFLTKEKDILIFLKRNTAAIAVTALMVVASLPATGSRGEELFSTEQSKSMIRVPTINGTSRADKTTSTGTKETK
jgi:hypothetical protein